MPAHDCRAGRPADGFGYPIDKIPMLVSPEIKVNLPSARSGLQRPANPRRFGKLATMAELCDKAGKKPGRPRAGILPGSAAGCA